MNFIFMQAVRRSCRYGRSLGQESNQILKQGIWSDVSFVSVMRYFILFGSFLSVRLSPLS